MNVCMCVHLLLLDLYSEDHAIAALARGKGASRTLQDTLPVQTHATALYHPNMEVLRPQVTGMCVCVCVCGYV